MINFARSTAEFTAEFITKFTVESTAEFTAEFTVGSIAEPSTSTDRHVAFQTIV